MTTGLSKVLLQKRPEQDSYYGADAPMLFERTEDSVTAVLSWFRSAFESEDVDLTYFEKQS